MINDIRIALRSLPRIPGFSLAFILTLGLGIGANTAIFSVINGVLLRPLPYPEADRIMHVRQPQTAASIEKKFAVTRPPVARCGSPCPSTLNVKSPNSTNWSIVFERDR